MEILDLTHNIEIDMSIFDAPWHSRFSIEKTGEHKTVGRQASKIVLGSHSGTHMDAPLHFIREGDGIDQIPMDKIMGAVSIIDCSGMDINGVVDKDFLKKLSLGKRIIFNFGWSKYWKTNNFYNGYPFFNIEAAKFLVEKQVEFIGIDTPSPDNSSIDLKDCMGSEKDSPVHKIFLENGIVLVEYLANMELIKNYEGWNVVALPLKIKDADGSPCRVCIYRGIE